MHMLLKNKVAVIYGAGGAVGGAVARAFAREGARLFLSGRSLDKVDAIATDIRRSGGMAETAVVDALDEQAVDRYLGGVVEMAGTIDISFSAVGIANTTLQGTPLVELAVDQLLRPIETYARSLFITARLAARRMLTQKAGVILAITAIPSRMGTPLVGGMAPAWGAVEALTRSLSAELAPQGIRVVCLRTHGMPETGTIDEVFGIHARAHGVTPAQFHALVAQQSNLGRLPTLAEFSDVAAFVASERAGAMTGTVVNLTGGGVAD
jgi:NAD(P)-dependent dehydrogenase (short-subunit alcohol dehydrogenase family)